VWATPLNCIDAWSAPSRPRDERQDTVGRKTPELVVDVAIAGHDEAQADGRGSDAGAR
jgi:hypothetical protein